MLKDLKSILSLLTTRERWKLAMLLGLMLISGFLEAVGVGLVPLFVAFLLDPSKLSGHELLGRFLPELPNAATPSLVLWASLLLLTFTLGKNAFLAGVYYVQSRIVAMQRARLANRMFQAYQKAPYDWLTQRSTSELQRNIENDTSQILNGVVMPTLDLILATVLSLSVIAVLVVATPGSTFVGMAIVGLGLFSVIRLLRKQLARTGQIARREYQRAIQSIQQGFGALVDARIIGCEPFLARVHRDSAIRTAQANLVRSTLTKITPLAIETVAVLGLLSVLFIILRSGESLTSALPVLSVLGVALIRLKQMAAKIAAGANIINGARPYVPGVLADLRQLERFEQARASVIDTKAKPIRQFESLKIDRLSYTYPSANAPAVREISLELKKGESIAFVGTTGCGKSTLVNCILGLLQPQSGTIRVNGLDIHAVPEGWRACLGYIPQNIYLIDDTLRANIAFGVTDGQIDEEQLRAALESAALADYVFTLEQGLDTVVGEQGIRLSGGQRQRLGIARALYFNPQVLVMDEATSALDNQTESEVMQAIQNLKRERTLIMIAHRLSTVTDCDRLYYLSEGQITGTGSYNKLFETSESFRIFTQRKYNVQNKNTQKAKAIS